MEEKDDFQVEIITFLRSEGIDGRNNQDFGCVSPCSDKKQKKQR